MNDEHLMAAASDAFLQAENGLAVPLDPDIAEGMGEFSEEALYIQDVLEDALLTAEGGEDV